MLLGYLEFCGSYLGQCTYLFSDSFSPIKTQLQIPIDNKIKHNCKHSDQLYQITHCTNIGGGYPKGLNCEALCSKLLQQNALH